LPNDHAFARVGYTVTKKIGNAVVRNRIKRRLRAAVAELLPSEARAGMDYVLIGRHRALHMPYPSLLDELRSALLEAHDARRGAGAAADRTPSP
jgi:ribonuclease P protein component